MKREEQIEIATATYINGRLKNNVPPEEIEEIRLAYQAGAIYADENPRMYTVVRRAVATALKHLWHDAHGDILPDIDKDVIVLCDNGKVCFGHRPNKKGYLDKSLVTGNIETFYPQTYGKGGWNISDVKWWLACDLPKTEEKI
jgi:hypothetical protein